VLSGDGVAGAALAFVVLFAALWLFERKKRDLDAFLIAVVIIAPLLIVLLFSLLMVLLDLGGYAQLARAVLYFVTTVAALWKFLELPIGRALAYGVLVLLVNGLVALPLYDL